MTNKTAYSVAIPLSEEERKIVKAKAKKEGYTLGGLIRSLLLNFAKEEKAEEEKA